MDATLKLVSVRRVATALAIWVGGLVVATPVASQAIRDTTLKREVLGDGIYLFRAPSALDYWTATNVVVIVNDQDVTVFDSNTRPPTTRMVIAAIRELTDKPVRTLINSHWHMDHWSGNYEYAKAFPGIQILATTATRDYMKRTGPPFFAHDIGGGLPQERAALDSAIRTGKLRDGTVLTAAKRRQLEQDIEDTDRFAEEMGAIPRVLPNVAFHDTLIFWSGRREFRLFSATGDATGSAVLYLPAEKLVVAGDVLVSPENGDGPPPWTTNSYAITPWLASLRSIAALDVDVIVPGQGPAFHDKTYLRSTVALFASIIDQIHAALEKGLVTLDDVQAVVNVDSIGRQYPPGAATPSAPFKSLVARLVRKVYQESLDGLGR